MPAASVTSAKRTDADGAEAAAGVTGTRQPASAASSARSKKRAERRESKTLSPFTCQGMLGAKLLRRFEFLSFILRAALDGVELGKPLVGFRRVGPQSRDTLELALGGGEFSVAHVERGKCDRCRRVLRVGAHAPRQHIAVRRGLPVILVEPHQGFGARRLALLAVDLVELEIGLAKGGRQADDRAEIAGSLLPPLRLLQQQPQLIG